LSFGEAVMLSTHNLTAYYGDFQALFGVDIEVESGEIVAVIGANGAGKSTLLKAITGLIRAEHEAVRFEGRPIGGMPGHEVLALGIAMVPEGRRLFPSLSVEENLLLGAYRARAGGWNLARVYELFPVLGERRNAPSTSLSGGQQQMVAIGRALMSNPRLLICDEMSLGLAPIVIKDIYESLPALKGEGITLIIVEQDVGLAMRVSDRLYCMQEGRVSLSGRSRDVTREQLSAAYFGV
jgi:branched-chain amino acid transport system ATP-binding protein